MTWYQATKSLGAFVYRQRTRYHNFFLSRRLARSREFSYTSDWVTGHDPVWRRVLAPLLGRPALSMLEIGSYHGRSSVWFLQNVLTDPGSRLHCLDLFVYPGQEPRFDHNIRLSGRAAQVRKLKGPSGEILPTLAPEQFELIYVDGDHRAGSVLLDGLLSWRLLKREGVMIFDDYQWEMQKQPCERPELGIDLILDALAGRCEVLHRGYQVILKKL